MSFFKRRTSFEHNPPANVRHIIKLDEKVVKNLQSGVHQFARIKTEAHSKPSEQRIDLAYKHIGFLSTFATRYTRNLISISNHQFTDETTVPSVATLIKIDHIKTVLSGLIDVPKSSIDGKPVPLSGMLLRYGIEFEKTHYEQISSIRQAGQRRNQYHNADTALDVAMYAGYSSILPVVEGCSDLFRTVIVENQGDVQSSPAINYFRGNLQQLERPY